MEIRNHRDLEHLYIKYIITGGLPGPIIKGMNVSKDYFLFGFSAWAMREHKEIMGFQVPDTVTEIRMKLKPFYLDKMAKK